MTNKLTASIARTLLPERPTDAHKYTFGRVLVVAGSPQYPGAASLATAGAARAGAGLVTLATGRSMLATPGRIPELVYHLLPEAEWGMFGETSADELLKDLKRYQALLIGPGLGREPTTRRFLMRLLGLDQPRDQRGIGFHRAAASEEQPRPPMPPTVLDADMLNLLVDSKSDEPQRRAEFFQRSHEPEPQRAEKPWWEQLQRGHYVLTPHAGEMAHLLGLEQIENDHSSVAEAAAKQWGQIVVLKGPATVIASPDGQITVHDDPNPAMATAGTGDVLAGIIVALLGQGLGQYEAAQLGVYLHSAAGRAVRDEIGDMGALASDLLPRIPQAIRALRTGA